MDFVLTFDFQRGCCFYNHAILALSIFLLFICIYDLYTSNHLQIHYIMCLWNLRNDYFLGVWSIKLNGEHANIWFNV